MLNGNRGNVCKGKVYWVIGVTFIREKLTGGYVCGVTGKRLRGKRLLGKVY